MPSVLDYITKQPLLPVVTITKNDSTTYTFNHFTSVFDFRVRRLQCTPPFDQVGGKFEIIFTSGDGTNSSTNTILNNINEGNEINIWIGKSNASKIKIFNGVIERTEINEPNKNYMDIKISGPDWGSDLLRSKIMNRSWIQTKNNDGTLNNTDNNVLLSQIFSDIITDNTTHATAEFAPDDHGMVYSSANVVVPQIRVPQFEANYEKFADKLKELVDMFGGTYYVDADKNFIVRDPTSTAADSGILLIDDYTDTTTWSSGKVGLIAPNSTYIRTLENHYRRIFGLGGQLREKDKTQQTDNTSNTLQTNWYAVKFRPTNNKDTMQIAVGVSKLGSPTNNLVVQLKEDLSSEPVGSTIRQWAIPPAEVASTIVWKYLDVNEEIRTDRDYWIVIPSVGNASNTYRWHRATGGSSLTGGTSTTGLASSWTVDTSNYRFAFEHYVSVPVLTIRSDFSTASQKHFHEEVVKRPDITDMQTLHIVLRDEFDKLNKKKEIFSGMIFAPDTLLQTGQTVKIKKSTSGYTFDASFVLSEIEYIFESTEEQGTGTLYYNIEATRYTTY